MFFPPTSARKKERLMAGDLITGRFRVKVRQFGTDARGKHGVRYSDSIEKNKSDATYFPQYLESEEKIRIVIVRYHVKHFSVEILGMYM